MNDAFLCLDGLAAGQQAVGLYSVMVEYSESSRRCSPLTLFLFVFAVPAQAAVLRRLSLWAGIVVTAGRRTLAQGEVDWGELEVGVNRC